jgi:hypothetical protein
MALMVVLVGVVIAACVANPACPAYLASRANTEHQATMGQRERRVCLACKVHLVLMLLQDL